MEAKPLTLAEKPQEGGDIRSRWEWVEPEVWTERMLTALETGVKGGKWHRIIDKVWGQANLRRALEKVVQRGGSAGVDHQSVEQLQKHSVTELERLEHQLRTRSYQPKALRRVWIQKLGSKEKRPLGVPAVRDRVVEGALRHVMEPIFERDFAPQSYGFRPRRGCKPALRRVEELLRNGHGWVVDVDLKSYFDTIPHGRLMQRIEEKIADGRVLELVHSMLKSGVMENMREWKPTEAGTPQGAVISPLLSNIYLNPLDWLMADSGYQMVRYADDIVVLCESQSKAEAALDKLRVWVVEQGLTLHGHKTRLVDLSQPGGFDFLGYHFERGMKWPRKKSMDRLKDTIRCKTRKTQGRSMNAVCEDLNLTLRGWFEYFKHSKANVFVAIDGYVRGRLRSILRKRQGRTGRGRGSDHQRWPNTYFTAQGLFSLQKLHRAACQPS